MCRKNITIKVKIKSCRILQKNTEVIKFEAGNKYKNMSEKKKIKKENIKEKGITCLI